MSLSAIDDISRLLRSNVPRWKHDAELCVRQTYSSDPQGRPLRIDQPQREILQALSVHDRVAVRSSHGVGKTTIGAWAAHWWLATRYPCLVGTLGGTWRVLEDKLWPAIHSWGNRWTLRPFFTWQTMELFGEPRSDWRAVAAASDDPDNVEGWHSPNLLIIVDEAKSLEERFWTAIRGAMSTGERLGGEVKVLVLSTPPLVRYGWYCDLFGVRSGGWKLIHVSADRSTLVSKAWIEEMERDYGRGSPEYQAKVLGEIPDLSSIAVFQSAWYERAMKRQPDMKDRRPGLLTCDVAREGEDLTVFGHFDYRKFRFLRFKDGTPAWKATNTVTEVVGMCVRAILETESKVMVIDDTGVGGGVTDGLIEKRGQKKIPRDVTIIPVKFGAAATNDQRFTCKKDELYWDAREALRTDLLALPSDDEVRAMGFPRGSVWREQLAAPIYDDQNSMSRIKVHDKRLGNTEKTKTLPTKSPDLAHCLILGVRYYMRQRQVETKPRPKNTVELFEQQLRDEIEKRKRKRPKERPGAFRRGAW